MNTTPVLPRYKYGYVSDEWGMNRSLGLIPDPAGNVCKVSDALAAIAAAQAAQPTDAERYRWLRSQHEGNSESCCVFSPDGKYDCLVPVGSLPGELDALVDAAINAKKGKK